MPINESAIPSAVSPMSQQVGINTDIPPVVEQPVQNPVVPQQPIPTPTPSGVINAVKDENPTGTGQEGITRNY